MGALKNQKPDGVDILFAGGCGEFGMNLTAYVHKKKLYIVDCGVSFADDYLLGTDALFPKINEFIEQYDGVTTYLITHGHEDHIGALAYFLKKWPAPVFATAWTLELIKDRLEKVKLSPKDCSLNLVTAAQTTKHNELEVNWIHKPHSIPMCCSLWLNFSNKVNIYHTGDFKMDADPGYEKAPDWQLIQKASKAGMDLLVADSTNANRSGKCPSEKSVAGHLETAFRKASGLIVCSTFASNLWRLEAIIEVATKLQKRVVLLGTGINKCLEIASKLKLYQAPSSVIIDTNEMRQFSRDQLIVIASGSQFEPRSALRRMIEGESSQVKLMSGDSLVLSSRIIPGNEKAIFKMMSMCEDQGIEVHTAYDSPGIHVSGHAYQEDLLELANALKPRYYIPVHGSFVQMSAHSKLIESSETIKVRNGSLLRLEDKKLSELEVLDLNRTFVDSWSRKTMDYNILRSRLRIGDSGMLLVSGFCDLAKQISRVDIEAIGLAFEDEIEWQSWHMQAQDKSYQLIEQCFTMTRNSTNLEEEVNEQIRRELRRKLSQVFIKKPVVISRISFF